MEGPFAADTEAQIKQFAASKGMDAPRWSRDSGDLVDDDEARVFLEQRERAQDWR